MRRVPGFHDATVLLISCALSCGPARAQDAPGATDDESTPADTRAAAREPVPPPNRVPSSDPPQAHPAEPGHVDRSATERARRVQRFGGSAQTESAVEAGLAWLAAHQSPDGVWRRTGHHLLCPPDDRCPGFALKRLDDDLDAGITGLALLAFLGGGYTDREGPYREVVGRAVSALLRMQQPHGGFSAGESMAGYNDSVATFALAEYYALTGDKRVEPVLDRAVQRLASTQQERGGWDYLPHPDAGRNDTSITAWAVQALHAAAAAGIEAPRATLIRAALHFLRMTETDGNVRYADAGTGTSMGDDLRMRYRYGPAMAAAGLTCTQLLGWRTDSVLCRRQQALLLAELPDAARGRGGDKTQLHGEYYWYYGTVAMFQSGGDGWPRWNGRMRDVLLPQQERVKSKKGVKRHSFGSWQPFGSNWGRWGRSGGRVYSTALNVLTLEIYYRHAPAYLGEPPVITSADWRAFVSAAPERDRRDAVRALRDMLLEVAEPVLVEMLTDSEASIAIDAAIALAWMDSPRGKALLEANPPGRAPIEQQPAEQALRRIVEIESLPPATGKVRMVDADRGLATVELSRAYVGMALHVVGSGGSTPATLRVIQRFTGRTVVVAEIVGGAASAGDRVEGR